MTVNEKSEIRKAKNAEYAKNHRARNKKEFDELCEENKMLKRQLALLTNGGYEPYHDNRSMIHCYKDTQSNVICTSCIHPLLRGTFQLPVPPIPSNNHTQEWIQSELYYSSVLIPVMPTYDEYNAFSRQSSFIDDDNNFFC